MAKTRLSPEVRPGNPQDESCRDDGVAERREQRLIDLSLRLDSFQDGLRTLRFLACYRVERDMVQAEVGDFAAAQDWVLSQLEAEAVGATAMLDAARNKPAEREA